MPAISHCTGRAGCRSATHVENGLHDGVHDLISEKLQHDRLVLDGELSKAAALYDAASANVCYLCYGNHNARLRRAEPFYFLVELFQQALAQMSTKVLRM